jgi:hypothetical protein
MRNLIFTFILMALLGYSASHSDAQTNPSGPYILRWSPDGTQIAGVGANYLQVWNGVSGSLLADLSFAYPTVEGLPNFVSPASWSPANRHPKSKLAHYANQSLTITAPRRS